MAKKTIAPIMRHFVAFIQPHDPLQQLLIPKAFMEDYLGGESCEALKATLKTKRSEEESWTVTIKENCFKHGWNNFARAQDLQPGDFLVFRHEGAFKFHVRVFDATCCEKEYPLIMDEGAIDRDTPQFTVTLQPSTFKWFTLHVPTKFARENGLTAKESCTIVLEDPKGKCWEVSYKTDQSRIGNGWRRFSYANKLEVGDVCTFKLVSLRSSKKIAMKVLVRRSINSTV